MARDTGLAGYVAIKFGTPYVYIPMLQGSSVDDSPNIQKVYLAANGAFGFEPENFYQGVSIPALYVRTLATANWFTPTNLNTMLITRTNGFIANAGAISYRFSGGLGSNDLEGAYTGCKIASMSISSAGVGSPISVEMVIMPYGTFSAIGGETFDTTSFTGEPFQSRDVVFSATTVGSAALTDVASWSIQFSNGLSPVNFMATGAAVGARVIPSDFANGFINMITSVVQSTGATIVDNANLATATQSVPILLMDPTHTAANSVLFNMNAFDPNRSSTLTWGLQTVARTYGNVRSGSTASIAISTPGS